MRIQDTDAILKESRYKRRGTPKPQGMFARFWQMLTGMFR